MQAELCMGCWQELHGWWVLQKVLAAPLRRGMELGRRACLCELVTPLTARPCTHAHTHTHTHMQSCTHSHTHPFSPDTLPATDTAEMYPVPTRAETQGLTDKYIGE